ncbi:hypothetical protein [Plasmodium yoelii yoelii]|uniref:Post-GPI attachment to proteins factor 3 n=1 Tax=Plasmodium yoelii yoelii TaxID=73239 RepID=Q7R7B5_PLAYO|nr:hypothetical protein [Plasmodium yoelii yoelii]
MIHGSNGGCLVDIIVLLRGSALQPLGSMETQCSDKWLDVSIHLCICQALAEPLRRQLYQAPVRKHFLASAKTSGYGVCIWDSSPGGAVSGWPFLQPLLHTLSSAFLPLSILVPLLRRSEEATLWSSFFMCFMWSVNFILGNMRFWANIHLSVSAYHVFSFVTGLPYTG